jgi:endonuclease YncB( thermonuclease family)
MKFIFLVAAFLLTTMHVNCQLLPNVFSAELVRAVDGDTYVMDVNYPNLRGGKREKLMKRTRIRVRLAKCDTYELSARDPEDNAKAIAATELARDLFGRAKVLRIRLVDKDWFGRFVAHIYVDGQSFKRILDKKKLLTGKYE